MLKSTYAGLSVLFLALAALGSADGSAASGGSTESKSESHTYSGPFGAESKTLNRNGNGSDSSSTGSFDAIGGVLTASGHGCVGPPVTGIDGSAGGEGQAGLNESVQVLSNSLPYGSPVKVLFVWGASGHGGAYSSVGGGVASSGANVQFDLGSISEGGNLACSSAYGVDAPPDRRGLFSGPSSGSQEIDTYVGSYFTLSAYVSAGGGASSPVGEAAGADAEAAFVFGGAAEDPLVHLTYSDRMTPFPGGGNVGNVDSYVPINPHFLPVPEPAPFAALGLGLLALVRRRRA